METGDGRDELCPQSTFRGLPLTAEQDAEVRHYIKVRTQHGLPWDTPPGSGCSVIFGENVTAATPGSAQGLYLIVSDVEAARNELLGREVEISGVFHDAAGAIAVVETSPPRLREKILDRPILRTPLEREDTHDC
jgi:hypothetical protein